MKIVDVPRRRRPRWRRQAPALGLLLIVALLVSIHWREQVLEALPPSGQIGLSALLHDVDVDHGIVVTMPDGVPLHASLYRPKGVSGPAATLLLRTPYHRLRHSAAFGAALFFARHGYAVLVQDLRGTGDSGGELLPWRDVAEDGVATLDWIRRQPWSTGKVGTFGCSALGETQFVLARRNHPAHVAMIPSGAGGAVGSAAGRYSYFGVFEGGVFELASAFGWFAANGSKDPHAAPARPFDPARLLRELPVSGLVARVRPAPSGYTEFLSTPLGDTRWEQWGYLSDADRSQVPAFVINTWGDQTVGDTLALAEQWRRQGVSQKVVIAPGKHCYHEESGTTTQRFGELELANAQRPWQDWYLAWFDRWLRGWFDRHAFGAVTTEDLVRDLDAHLFDGAPPIDLDRWLYQPGLPEEAAPPPSPALEKVDAGARAFLAGASPVTLGAGAWCAQEWRHFLGTILGQVPEAQLAALDDAFALSTSENTEVLFAWLRVAARSRYAPALPVIERFLGKNGRGKYLRPLYTELLAGDWGAEAARRAYAAARPRYHGVVQNALDALLGAPGAPAS